MIKFSKLADYAVVLLAVMSEDEARLLSASGLAEKARLPEPTVAKVLKLLAKAQIISSTRGASGGYQLMRPVSQISVAQVVMAVDGPVALTSCVEASTESCDYACHCPVRGRWDEVNLAIRSALESVSLADMMKNEKTAYRSPVRDLEGIRV